MFVVVILLVATRGWSSELKCVIEGLNGFMYFFSGGFKFLNALFTQVCLSMSCNNNVRKQAFSPIFRKHSFLPQIRNVFYNNKHKKKMANLDMSPWKNLCPPDLRSQNAGDPFPSRFEPFSLLFFLSPSPLKASIGLSFHSIQLMVILLFC